MNWKNIRAHTAQSHSAQPVHYLYMLAYWTTNNDSNWLCCYRARCRSFAFLFLPVLVAIYRFIFCFISVAHRAFHHAFAIYRFIRSERDALNALRAYIHLIRATVMVFQSSLYECIILHVFVYFAHLCLNDRVNIKKKQNSYQIEHISGYMPTSYQFHFTLK